MEATHKAKEIDKLITNITGKDRKETVAERKCIICGNTNLVFRDSLSVDEYKISGMCQSCQDDTFGV